MLSCCIFCVHFPNNSWSYTSFSVLICHLHIFHWWCVFQIYRLLFNWIGHFLIEFWDIFTSYWVLGHLDIVISLNTIHKYFLSDCNLSFYSCNSIILKAEFRNFDETQFIHFFPFVGNAFGITSKKTLSNQRAWLSVLCFTFRSTIHFELIFMCDVRYGPKFTFSYCLFLNSPLVIFHMIIWLFQHHFLTRLSFLHCTLLQLCQKSVAFIYVGLFLELSTMSLWSICLSLCQHYIVLFTRTLWKFSKLGHALQLRSSNLFWSL